MDNQTIQYFIVCYRGKWIKIPVREPINEISPSSAPLTQRIHQNIESMEILQPSIFPIKEIKKICVDNELELNWTLPPESKEFSKSQLIQGSSRRYERKYTPLSIDERKRFVLKLRELNEKAALIAEIIIFLNDQLDYSDEYISLEEVLRLKTSCVETDGVCTTITLMRFGPNKTHLITEILPYDLEESLLKIIDPHAMYVFSTIKDTLLCPGNVSRIFNQAGIAIGLHSVGSLSLRPIPKPNVSRNYVPIKKASKGNSEISSEHPYKEVNLEEWEALCKKYPNLRASTGRPSKYEPIEKFNAVLFHLRTKTPLRKLPNKYPPYATVESQIRRWGGVNAIKKILKSRL